jgi:hypothetical protein
MFDIDNYNSYLLYGIYPVIVLVLFFAFRRRLFLLFDPLGMHLIWISSYFVLAILMMERGGLQMVMCVLFFMINAYYLSWLWFFLRPVKVKVVAGKYDTGDQYVFNRSIIGLAYWVVTAIYFVSQFPFFRYALSVGSLVELPLYRFVGLQGGEPIFRTLVTGIHPFFIYFSLVRIIFIPGVKKVTWLLLLVTTLLAAIGGGRSIFLLVFLYVCGFVYSHRACIDRRFTLTVNRVTPVVLMAVIAVAMLVSSFYENDGSGVLNIINRIPATADGIEYYVKYNGYDNVHSGPIEFIQSVFGLYIKTFAGDSFNYKNIGHQLAELASGSDLQFAQGPNFSLSLQVMVLGFYWFPVYLMLLAYLAAKMRNYDVSDFRKMPLQFFLSVNAFLLPGDLEYGIYVLLCGMVMYFFVVRPTFLLKRIFSDRFVAVPG